jgi:hypothetical protein
MWDFPREARANVAKLTKMPRDEVVSLLFRGFAGKDFAPLILPDEPSYAQQLHWLFGTLDTVQQEKLKNATVRAMCEWDPAVHSLEVLEDLAVLADYVRASAAVDQIRVIVDYLRPTDFEWEAYERIMEILIGVAKDFAPLPEVRSLFRRLFYADSYERFAAQIFLGLCECKPDEYPEYVPRFLSLCDRPDLGFSQDMVWSQFADLVSLPIIVAGFAELAKSRQQDWHQLYEKLCNPAWGPLKLMSEGFGDELALRLTYRFVTSNVSVSFPLTEGRTILTALQGVSNEGRTTGPLRVLDGGFVTNIH